ncbi:MAG: hypothetical protein COZ96_02030 [Nitrospirae bacterium CG_4_8_14_3_um_filter_70_85]|nr:MAG: hypothetical protein COS73_06905 [Nitrospirae bacterium CG06_land_8_20_14_3_00_70_43]PIW83702.1 MAG: hypothetical protein COZ96_02030 [Nitrospirae bacterium CG_4_8_14_3_um_filter_70_85]PIX83389.1 MAG: hypothetical protein COZ33_05680 [Nitrospirae bacterium CG_4_10_14_3_um_filter_70_108]PJB96769.1 MAG: hypothetical protein CO080_02175 [Nitrospirae bacterium CG_4_9_14_0_8_um_filter_70_14]
MPSFRPIAVRSLGGSSPSAAPPPSGSASTTCGRCRRASPARMAIGGGLRRARRFYGEGRSRPTDSPAGGATPSCKLAERTQEAADPGGCSMLRITDSLLLPDGALRVRFIHARGPGGQHVNKAATGVEVRVALAALPPEVALRIAARYPAHVTGDDELVVAADGERSQLRNRRAAETRLVAMVLGCLTPPRPRCPTRVPPSSRRARRVAKRHRGEIKRWRRGGAGDEG